MFKVKFISGVLEIMWEIRARNADEAVLRMKRKLAGRGTLAEIYECGEWTAEPA